MKEKLKSIPLWSAVLCLIGIVAKQWFKFDIPAWEEISAEVILIAGNLFGIANNPSDRTHF